MCFSVWLSERVWCFYSSSKGRCKKYINTQLGARGYSTPSNTVRATMGSWISHPKHLGECGKYWEEKRWIVIKEILKWERKEGKRKHKVMGQYGLCRLLFHFLHTSIVGVHMSEYVCGCMCACRTSADLKAMFYTFQHVQLSLLWGMVWESCPPITLYQANRHFKTRSTVFHQHSHNTWKYL